MTKPVTRSHKKSIMPVLGNIDWGREQNMDPFYGPGPYMNLGPCNWSADGVHGPGSMFCRN